MPAAMVLRPGSASRRLDPIGEKLGALPRGGSSAPPEEAPVLPALWDTAVRPGSASSRRPGSAGLPARPGSAQSSRLGSATSARSGGGRRPLGASSGGSSSRRSSEAHNVLVRPLSADASKSSQQGRLRKPRSVIRPSSAPGEHRTAWHPHPHPSSPPRACCARVCDRPRCTTDRRRMEAGQFDFQPVPRARPTSAPAVRVSGTDLEQLAREYQKSVGLSTKAIRGVDNPAEQFRFDLAVRRYCCCYFRVRIRLVHCSKSWRAFTGTRLWKRGKGWRIKTFVAAAICANLASLVATRNEGVGEDVQGWQGRLRFQPKPWAVLECSSAGVLCVELALQSMAAGFHPWLLDPRHMFRVLLCTICALSVFNVHPVLRVLRCLLFLRLAEFIPWRHFRVLNTVMISGAPTIVRAIAAFFLILATLSLLAMQQFGGQLRGRCVPVHIAEALDLLPPGYTFPPGPASLDQMGSWAEIGSWANPTRGGAAMDRGASEGSGSMSLELPPVDSMQVCWMDAVHGAVCPVVTVCVDIVTVLGNNGRVPSFDNMLGAVTATYSMSASRWVQPMVLITQATGDKTRIATTFVMIRVGSALFAVGLFCAVCKHLLSPTMTRSMLNAKRSQLSHLRRRVLGPQGHRIGQKSWSEILASLRRATPWCCYAVGDQIRPLLHSGVFRTILVTCSIFYTALVLSTHTDMAPDVQHVYDGLFFFMNIVFVIEAIFKIFCNGLIAYCSSIYNIVDLAAPILSTALSNHGSAMASFGSLRCLRILHLLKRSSLPAVLEPLRSVTATVHRASRPVIALWLLLGLSFCILNFVVMEVFPDDIRFRTQTSTLRALTHILFVEEWGRLMNEGAADYPSNMSRRVLYLCFYCCWGMVSTVISGLGTACFIDTAERDMSDSGLPGKLVAVREEVSPDSDKPAPPKKEEGMIITTTETWQLLQAFGEDSSQQEVNIFFEKYGDRTAPMRLPTLLRHIAMEHSIVGTERTMSTNLRWRRFILVLVRSIAVLDVVSEIWLWLNATCAQGGQVYNCWVPTSSAPRIPSIDWAFVTEGGFPAMITDVLLLSVVRSVVVVVASMTDSYLGFAGVFCDGCIGYLGLKMFLVDSEASITARSAGYWLLLWTGLVVSTIFRLLACAYVLVNFRRKGVVEPSVVSGLLSADRCDDFLDAVRFWLVFDRLQNGYLSVADLALVLRALNGGKHEAPEPRFDPEHLAIDLMRQMDCQMPEKIYLHEFLSSAASHTETPLTRLLHEVEMVRVVTAFVLADSSHDLLLERSELGTFVARIGLRLTHSDLDDLFLQIDINDVSPQFCTRFALAIARREHSPC